MIVCLIGMGPGDTGMLTLQAKKALSGAGIVIGAQRLLAALPADCPAECYTAVDPAEIMRLVAANLRAGSICILMSGDTGFYSGAKRLLPLLAGHKVKVLPGISSVQYFAAQLRRPWQDWKLVSAHGKDCDAAGLVRDHAETFFLTGGRWTVPALCKDLKRAGWGDCAVTVGENLGSARERIRAGTAAELAPADVGVPAVMLVENPRPRRTVSCGLPDSVFARGSVPMTKSEVRSVILSKLRLCAADIVYDIGAGTGSVSVEAALLVRAGHVYAIEHKPAGCRLIRENAKKLGVFNLTCIAGRAPDVLAGLPPPDAVFIGGSGGRLKAILERLLALNPAVRLVLSAITLETLTAAAESFFHLPLQEVEIVQIAASRARQAGGQHLMRAQNPVFIISGAGIK